VERLLKLLFFIGLGVYFLIAVLVRTPAEWGAWVALNALPGLSLTGVSGTLWNGRAASAQTYIYGQKVDLGAVQWRLKAWALLGLNACVDLKSQLATGNVCHGISGKTTVSKAMMDELPANLFSSPGVQVGGTGSATLQHAVLARDGSLLELQGSASWQRASVNVGTGWFNLGSFAADLAGNDEGGIRARLQDLEGDFAVDMEVEFTPNKPFRAAGTVTPRDSAPPEIREALSAFAEQTDDGAFQIAWPIGGG
jgi:general secretion pathway protein N